MSNSMKRKVYGTRRRTRSVGSMPFSWQYNIPSDDNLCSSSTSKEKGCSSFYQSDSDDLCSGFQRNASPDCTKPCPIKDVTKPTATPMESESIHENLARCIRRKRKHKKSGMDVDPHHGRVYGYSSGLSQGKKKRILRHSQENRICFVNVKNKRKLREKILFPVPELKLMISEESKAMSKLSLCDEPETQCIPMEVCVDATSGSSLSSSESEAGVFTNDEGLEGDDEQSDWIDVANANGKPVTFETDKASVGGDSFEQMLQSPLDIKIVGSDLRSSRRRGRFYKPNVQSVSAEMVVDKDTKILMPAPNMKHDTNADNVGITVIRRHTFNHYKKKKRASNTNSKKDSPTDVSSQLVSPVRKLSDISSSDSNDSPNSIL